MYIIQKGRPANCSKRLEKEIRTYDFLDALGISYDRIDHPPTDTMDACEKIEHSLGTAICKNLLLCNRQETKFYLLMMPGKKKFVPKVLSKELGVSRLSFAQGAYMEKFLDINPGSLSVLGLMNDTAHHIQLVMDEEILKDDFFGCHPCINTSSLRIKTADLIEIILTKTGHTPMIVKQKDAPF